MNQGQGARAVLAFQPLNCHQTSAQIYVVRCCRRAPAGHHPGLQAQVRCIARQQGQLAANASAQRRQGQ
jgi:hypothetical protein